VALSLGVLIVCPAARAQTLTGSVSGRVTTQSGTAVLPGAMVRLVAEGGQVVASVTTDAEGRYLLEAVPPGRYRLMVEAPGFQEVVAREGLVIRAGQATTADLDVALGLSAQVQAERPAPAPVDVVAAGTVLDLRRFDILPVRGDDFLALLPMLPGVVRGPDGKINLKGGRPAQTGLQVGPSYASDPTTGDIAVALPVDAVSTLAVVPNPYAAEYGRFSAGVTQVDTMRGGDDWTVSVHDIIPVPCFKLCSGGTLGPRNYDPRAVVSGPLVPGRAFLAQSVQFHEHKSRLTNLPKGEADTTLRSLDLFTRLDVVLGPHSLTGTISVFPQNLGYVGLDTFHDQAVTPDLRRRGYSLAVTDTLQMSDAVLLDTTISRTRYDISVTGRGPGAMVLTPEGVTGTYFNRQDHASTTTQWIETISLARRAAGDHLVKLGVDVLWLSFSGTSASTPVEVRRADGTLAERFEFGDPTRQRVSATDVAVFAQDRWRVNDRLLLEGGARFDRDGVSQHTSLSPRFGLTVAVLPEGRGVLRTGIGLYAERLPLRAGAFESIEAPTLQRFTADGATPDGPAVTYQHRLVRPLHPTAARVWNVEYNQRLPHGWLFKINHLVRRSHHELVVDVEEPPGTGALVLESEGRARYRETEVTLRRADDRGREVTLTYVRSRSEGNLNAFDMYFGNLRSPIVRPDEYGVTAVDVPNRFIALGVAPVGRWRLSGLAEIRDGFPYSLVDERQQYVGPRNAGGRFPLFYTVDLSLSREITIKGHTFRLGIRSTHVLGNFIPRDIQANVDAAGFGTLTNGIRRRIGLTFEIQP